MRMATVVGSSAHRGQGKSKYRDVANHPEGE